MALRFCVVRRAARVCHGSYGPEVTSRAGFALGATAPRTVGSVDNVGSRRGMMAKAKDKKGDKDKEKKQEFKAADDNGVGYGVIPINYLKAGKDPPIKPDEEYPDWLWQLPQKSKALISRTHEDDMDSDDMRRLLQLRNRDFIKEQNIKGQF